MNKIIVQLVGLVLVSAGLILPQLAFAGPGDTPTLTSLNGVLGTATLSQIIVRIVQLLLGLLGLLAIAYLVYGGYIWQTAGGDEAKVTKAKNIILQTVIGLVIIFSSYAISAFLFAYFAPSSSACDTTVDPTCGTGCDSTVTPVDDCSIGMCPGTHSCVNSVWTACSVSASCTTYKQYANLTGWKSVEAGLQRNYLSSGNNTVNSVPNAADLQIRGMAKNQGGSFTGLDLFWGVSASPMDYSAAAHSAFASVPTDQELVENVFAPLDASALDKAAIYKMRLTGKTSGLDINSVNFQFKVRPIHCFNNTVDTAQGETGLNCGGECGACDGDSCNKSAEAGVCSADSSLCSSGVCSQTDCLCVAPPALIYVSPARDVNADNDGHTAVKYLDDIGNGAPGNLITLEGRNFGAEPGQVWFRSKDGLTQIQAELASDCSIPAACQSALSSYWSNNQIIVKVPAGASVVDNSDESAVSSATANYEIYVVNKDNLSSLNNANENYRSRLFEADKIDRPGICNICPAGGASKAPITISGYKFPTAGGKIVWNFSAYDYAQKVWQLNNVTTTGSSAWTTSQVFETVPENRSGKTGIRVFDGSRYSNFYNFMISAGGLNDPCGYDSNVCSQDITTCKAGLACSDKDCTCQEKTAESCVFGTDAPKACNYGGCSGTQSCTAAGAWSKTCDIPAASHCVPFLGSAAGRAIFSWAFSAYKKPTAGMSCASDLWGDGTCDINGCLDSRLSCDTASSSEEWIELYNPLSFDVTLAGWHLVYGGGTAHLSYDSSLSADANAAKYSLSSLDLSSVSIARNSFILIDKSKFANFDLAKNYSSVFLVDNTNAVIDSAGYGDNGVEPAFSPASIGRKIDGLHTGTTTDFSYFSNSSPLTANNASKSTSSGAISINEISLAHDACTCVPKAQMCSSGSVDSASCAPIGQCKAVRKCDAAGHYGSCVQSNPSCIPYLTVPSSTIAVFTWKFGAGTGIADAGPKVVTDCGDLANCQNQLPSPTPWDAKWNSTTIKSISDAKACLNAVISARFSAAMDPSTLDMDHIILYSFDSGSNQWTDANGALVDSIATETTEENGVNYFKINLKADLAKGTKYRVVLLKTIQDELGRKLIDDASGVNGSSCDGAGINSGAKVCWDFNTRADGEDLYCPIGCINCSPTKYFNRYYGQDRRHAMTPISRDNVCMMLDARRYDWQWYEEEQKTAASDYLPSKVSTSDYWFIENSANVFDYYSMMTDPQSGSDGLAAQAKGSDNTGMGTSTAETESNFKANQYDGSWFTSADQDYFRVSGKIVSSQQTGSCSAHNNFTDPVVIENQFCSKSADAATRIMQSPSPWKGQDDACKNADIFVLFSRNMLNSSLIDVADNSLETEGKLKNIDVYACGDNAAAATSSNYAVPSGCVKQNNWTGRIFKYSHPNLTMKQLMEAPDSESTTTEGIMILPPSGQQFDENAYYKVVIRGGENGVRGGERDGAKEAAIGVLQVPSSNAKMVNPVDDQPSYFWYFKTGTGLCQIDQVNVHPQLKFMSTLGETQEYDTDPTAANCNHLNPDAYDWSWKSLLDPKDNNQLCGTDPKSGDGIATICGKDDTTCSQTQLNLTSSVAKAFGHLEGNTKITARADKTAAGSDRCQDKWGYGDLQVGYGGFSVIGGSNTDCLNSEISFRFSQDAKNLSAVSPNKNILLYECMADDKSCLISQAVPVADFSIKTPAGLNSSPYDPNPAESSQYLLTADLTAGKTYRVVIKGGDSGIKSKFDSKLSGLNYSTAGTADKDSYSWLFTISASAQICRYIGIGLNPCPNGVWNVTAAAETQNLSVKLYKGSDTGGDNCISDAQMRNLGFWRAALERFVRLIKMFFGNRSAMAADYWCLISDEAFPQADLDKMRLGDYKRETVIDGAAATLSAYTGENDGYKINYTRQKNWDKRTEYKAVVVYERNDIFGTSTDQVLTNSSVCPINDVRFDVWPRGTTRKNDSFFCASNPSLSKPDECGRFSEEPEDDDMSAVWTKDFPKDGYNMCADGSVSSAACASYKSGNNHLYRLWALSGAYTVRGNFAANSNRVINISGTQTTSTKIAASGLSDNSFFVTSGFNPGRSLFRAYAYDQQDAYALAGDKAGTANKELPIFTYFCSNPWPDATNFPFIDSSNNCNAAGVCLNTNFGTYYCRDSGIEKTCVHGDTSKLGQVCSASSDCYVNKANTVDGSCLLYTYDDLPSIGNYNALTGKFDNNSGVVTGTYGDTCNNLPSNFKATVGYLSRDGKSYVWNNSGSVYASSGGEWEEINKGAWAIQGLPGSFKPVFAYTQTRGGTVYDILFSSTEIYYYDGASWKKDTALAAALPKGFWPIMGVINPTNNTSLYLANSAGQLVIMPYNSDGSINKSGVSNPAAIKYGSATVRPKLMQRISGGVVILDYSNNLYMRGSGDWIKQDVSNMPKSFAPVFTSALSDSEFTAWIEPLGYVFRQDSGIYWSVTEMSSLNNVVCDNKIKDFLFAGIVSASAKPISIKGSDSATVETAGFISIGSQETTDDNSAIRLNAGGLRYAVNVPSSGKYYVTLETTNADNALAKLSETLPVGFSGSYGTCEQGTNLRGNVFYHSMLVDIDGLGQSNVTAIASDLATHQFTQTPTTYDLSAGQHTINIAYNNDCYCPGSDSANCAYGTADPNLRLYTVKLVPASAAANDAIGIRVYNNSGHLSPAAWYKARFIGQALGSLQSLLIDGYHAVTEGTTAYINAADFSNQASGNTGTTTVVPTCTDFNYSDWSQCSIDGWHTRTVSSGIPAGCTGGSPILGEACPACVYTYKNISACLPGNYQTREVDTKTPALCVGDPVLTQPCTYCGLTLTTNVAGLDITTMTTEQTISYEWYSSNLTGVLDVKLNGASITGGSGESGKGTINPLKAGTLVFTVSNGCGAAAQTKTVTVTCPAGQIADPSTGVCSLPVYTVAFNSNGGTTEASPSYMSISEGSTVGSLPTPPTKTGKVFMGWNTASDGSGSVFTASTIVTGDINVYAMWNNPPFSCGDSIINEHDGLTYGSVTALDGRCWLDRNLGASRVATAYNDMASYGDYYQWGRATDGHEKSTSLTTTVLSSSDTPGHSMYIIGSLTEPYDWRSPQNNYLWQGDNGINNPCPAGFRLPTENEFNNFLISEGLSVGSKSGIANLLGIFNSKLKLPAGGARLNGVWTGKGTTGIYWTQDISSNGVYSERLYVVWYPAAYLQTSHISFDAWDRSAGYSVRCIRSL